jgi:OOP family OmpA-OmpF porin
MIRGSVLFRATRCSVFAALLSVSLCSCAYLQQPRRWGTCAVVGSLVGAGAGAGIGIAINENSGDHENNVAWSLGGAGVGAVLGGLAGHVICDPIITPPPPPSPPPPPPSPPLPPPVKQKLVLRSVHFEFNKYNIRPGDAAILDEAAATLKGNPNATVNVNGYCDAIGSVEYNLKLSDRRADAVVDYLVNAGIPSGQLIPHGYGKSDFIATNDTAEGRAQNRRVELVPNQ